MVAVADGFWVAELQVRQVKIGLEAHGGKHALLLTTLWYIYNFVTDQREI